MKVVVVGASSGIGRHLGIELGKAGEEVALLARRHDRLVAATEEAGPSAHAIACDVTDEGACRTAVDEAAERLGGIDGLVYCTGIGPLRRLKDLDGDTWRRAFDTNVIGASLVTAAAIPHLEASEGAALYLSSVSGTTTAPWPGLGAYVTSKAALERLVDAWRAEHPRVGFTTVVVGDTMGGEGESMTQFANEWDPELAGEVMPGWIQKGLITGSLMEIAELVRVIETVLRTGASACIPRVAVVPRPPA